VRLVTVKLDARRAVGEPLDKIDSLHDLVKAFARREGKRARGFDWRGVGEFAGRCASYANNPWTPEYWNKTAQARIYQEDKKKADVMAKAACVDLFAAHPKQKAA